MTEQRRLKTSSLQYGARLAAQKRSAWIAGILLHIYFFMLAAFVVHMPSAALCAHLAHALAWLMVGMLEAWVLEDVKYRRLLKRPEFYREQISALSSMRNGMDIKACWHYWQTFRVRHVAGEIVAAIGTGAALCALGQWYFAFSVLTGYSLGVDAFWIPRRKTIRDRQN